MKKLMFMFCFTVLFVSCNKDSSRNPGVGILKTPTLSRKSNLGAFSFLEKFKFSDTLNTDKQPPMHTLVLEIGTAQVISIQVEENGADEKEFVVGKGALIGYIAKNPIYIYVNRQKYMGMFIGEDNVDTNSIECIVVEKLSYFVNKSFVFQWKNDYIILKDVSN